jgi:acetoacetyl-CoA synthetase
MDFLDLQYSGSKLPVKEGTILPDVEYFPNVRINFAENLLKHGHPTSPLAKAEALVSVSEARPDIRWTFARLREDASRVQHALAKMGITEHDAVAAYLPNIGETILAMLGTTSIGAMWTSTSPDFGVTAVVDRFSQVKPKVLFTANGYVAKGERISMLNKVEDLLAALPSIQRVVMIHLLDNEIEEWAPNSRLASSTMSWDNFLRKGACDDGTASEN